MITIGLYRIALLPGADEQAFVAHMTNVFGDPNALQLTRVTRGFVHHLLKVPGDFRQYVWQATVDLVTSAGYDFRQNLESVQKAVADFGVVIGLETYTSVTESR